MSNEVFQWIAIGILTAINVYDYLMFQRKFRKIKADNIKLSNELYDLKNPQAPQAPEENQAA